MNLIYNPRGALKLFWRWQWTENWWEIRWLSQRKLWKVLGLALVKGAQEINGESSSGDIFESNWRIRSYSMNVSRWERNWGLGEQGWILLSWLLEMAKSLVVQETRQEEKDVVQNSLGRESAPNIQHIYDCKVSLSFVTFPTEHLE